MTFFEAGRETPSTKALMFGTSGRFLCYALGFVIADALLFHRPHGPVRGALAAWMIAFIYAVARYRKTEWRLAVAPEHAAGLGLLGILMLWAWPFVAPGVHRPMVTLQYIVLVVVTAIPGTLFGMAIREIRRRQVSANQGGI